MRGPWFHMQALHYAGPAREKRSSLFGPFVILQVRQGTYHCEGNTLNVLQTLRQAGKACQGQTLQLIWPFVSLQVRPGAYLRWEHLGLPRKLCTLLERLARDKRSSLFGPFVILQVRPGAYPGEGEHLELTCKGLTGTNTIVTKKKLLANTAPDVSFSQFSCVKETVP